MKFRNRKKCVVPDKKREAFLPILFDDETDRKGGLH